MSNIRGMLLHLSVICSLVCITARILDYYNPYMDFAGHVSIFQLGLYAAVILLEVTRRYKESRHKSKKQYHTTVKSFNYV